MLAIFPISSYDTWWILAAGERMLETREVLRTGIGSWTRASAPYAYHGWMFAILTAVCHRIAGEWGLILLRSLLAGCCFLFLGLASMARGARGAGILLLPGLALILGYTNLFWPVRPQSASQTLLALTLLLMSWSHLAGWSRCLTMTSLTVVWANLHGGVLLGIAVLWIIVIGENLDSLRRGVAHWRSMRTPDVKLLLFGSMGCLLTPYGYTGILSALRHIRGEAVATLPLEWSTPRIADFPIFLLLLAITAAGVLASFLTNRMRWIDPLLFLFFSLMGLKAVRYLAIASMGLSFVGSACWVTVLGEHHFKGRREKFGIIAAMVVIMLLLWRGVGRDQWLFHGGWNPGRPLPVGAVDFMSRNQIVQGVFNPYEWGGYLIWRFQPDNAAFIDGRIDLYPQELVRDYLAVQDGNPGWRTILNRYSVQVILWRNGPAGARLLQALECDQTFIPIYKDPVATVYVRKNGQYQRFVKSG